MSKECSNRTFMELKSISQMESIVTLGSSNRTFMELKFSRVKQSSMNSCMF